MSAHSRAGDATLGGEPPTRTLVRERARLTALVLAALRADVPVYATLPSEELEGEIALAVSRSIELFLGVLAGGEAPPGVLEEARRSAARRAEEEIPLGAVLGAYSHAVRILVAELTARAGPDELEGVRTAALAALDFLRVVGDVVAEVYVLEARTTSAAHRDAARALFDRLLDGLPDPEHAEPGGVEPAARYAVLRLAVDRHADEAADDVDARIAGRRKLRRLQEELARHDAARILSSMSASEGTLLVPLAPDAAEDETLRALDALVERLAEAADVDVRAGLAMAARRDVPRARREAQLVLDAVLASGRDPGVHRVDDVALELQLAAPGPARDVLARRIAAVAARDDLLDTLRAFFAHAHRRTETARAMHVHANTIDYRLRSIERLSGLHPGRPRDAVALRAALAAHDATRTAGDAR